MKSNIRYECIGAHPEVNHLATTLPTLMKTYEATRDRQIKVQIGNRLVRAAEHFYGLSIADFLSVHALLDAMRSIDQHLLTH